MSGRIDREVRLAIALVGAIFLGAVLVWVLASSVEARAFERVTGKRVSTWDAMFLDLRVMEPAQ